MPQGWKMMSLWEEVYDGLNQLRLEQNTTFNGIISKLLESYEEQHQEPKDHYE